MAFVPLVFLCFLCLFKSSASYASITANYATNINLNSVLFSGEYEFIDLSHPFDNQTVYWPGNKKFEFTKKREGFTDDSWYAANEFAAAEHGGTHIDAPYHFCMMGNVVGEIPLDKLIVSLIVVDINEKVKDNPNYVLTNNDLDDYLDYLVNYHTDQNCVIVFKFGWSKYYKDVTQYLGIDEKKKTLNFPGLSAEVAEIITNRYKNVVGIGVDVASVDPGSSKNYPVHKIILKNGLYNMENVNLSRSLPDHGCTALVMPMKIAEGTGAPLRLVAICPKNKPKL